MSKSVKESHYNHFEGKDVSTRTRNFEDYNASVSFASKLRDAHFSVSTRYSQTENTITWDVETKPERTPACPECGEVLDYVNETGRTTYSADRHRDGSLDDVETDGGEEGESWDCPECSHSLDDDFVSKHFDG